jgi:hypothetical protein
MGIFVKDREDIGPLGGTNEGEEELGQKKATPRKKAETRTTATKASPNTVAKIGFEQNIWKAAEELRAQIAAGGEFADVASGKPPERTWSQ